MTYSDENRLHFSLSTIIGGMVVAALWFAAYTASLRRQEMERTVQHGARWLGIVKPEDRDKINVLRMPEEYRRSRWKIYVPQNQSATLYAAAIPGSASVRPLTTLDGIRQAIDCEAMRSFVLKPGTHELVVSESKSSKVSNLVAVTIDDQELWQAKIIAYIGRGFFDCDTKALPPKQLDPEVILQTRYQEQQPGSRLEDQIEGFIVWLEW